MAPNENNFQTVWLCAPLHLISSCWHLLNLKWIFSHVFFFNKLQGIVVSFFGETQTPAVLAACSTVWMNLSSSWTTTFVRLLEIMPAVDMIKVTASKNRKGYVFSQLTFSLSQFCTQMKQDSLINNCCKMNEADRRSKSKQKRFCSYTLTW